MAYADPQSVTINAIANSLPRISSGVNQGAFQKDDSTVKLSVAHTYGKRVRRTIRLDHKKTSADAFNPFNMNSTSMSCYIVADVPLVGYSVAEQKQIVDGLTAYLTASSGARVTQLLGGEN